MTLENCFQVSPAPFTFNYVHGRTELWRTPDLQHQRALENEPVSMGGLGQPVEETLHGEVLQQFVEWPLVAPGAVEKALPDRRGHVAGESSYDGLQVGAHYPFDPADPGAAEQCAEVKSVLFPV